MMDDMESGAMSERQWKEVSLEEVLDARDRRVERQAYLRALHRTPILSITLNMPGSVKRTPLSSFFFNDQLARLKARLRAMGAAIEEEIITFCPAGDEAILAVSNLPVLSLKTLAVSMEERSPAGRLLDLDILDEDGAPVKRTSVGAKPRPCLLCDLPASVCGSSRAHSLSELTDKVTRMLEQAVCDALVDAVVSMASKASSFELMVSMKPGLVTYTDSGSHSDMDRFTFAKSQTSLLPYYREAFLAGWEGFDGDKAVIDLRLEGMEAEHNMFQATGGINTHRGWIYIAGILLTAAGRIGASGLRRVEPPRSEKGMATRSPLTRQDAYGFSLCQENAVPTRDRTVGMATLLSDTAASIAHLLEKSLELSFFENVRRNMSVHLNDTSTVQRGELVRPYLAGVRKEAVGGFPSIFQVGLPLLDRSLQHGDSENLAGQRVVLALLATAQDTTLGKRGGLSAVMRVRRYVLEALGLEDEHSAEALIRSTFALNEEALKTHLDALSEYFIGFHLSCGGVADLLAGSYLTRDLCSLLERIAAHD